MAADVNNVTESYLIAAKYGMRHVMDTLIELIRDNFIVVSQTKQFLELPVDLMELFLSDTFVNVGDELDVFAAALRWVDYNKQERLSQSGGIRPKVEEYLAHSQSGFRPNRSTSDVVCTHKRLAAKTNVENVCIKISGIDMSAAFDAINRNKILTILEDILEEDELKLVRFLLCNTTIETRINKADIQASFNSNIGTPQGDGLSPALFTIYLEHALRKTRTVIGDPTTKLGELIPREIAFADDVDLIGSQYIDIDAVEKALKEFDLISKEETEWRKTNKVGSLMGDTKDVERREQLSNVALYKLKNVWISKDKIKREIKIKLYKSLVKSIIICNCGTWALTQTEANKLDTFHRKQLRNILDIHYPNLISNKSIY
ncbi:very-long-chain enoyl-CoA reductase [Elysia marginata]|uniref:Very-long-chain enoyl-CoA reductase n=1 Tax=Elysia marginata TaxID=1093978 RepID=A0AAV4G8W6_9GAST|nr:very-long-chain enoyl-CoA reductase [Elysia marginata]